MACSPAQGEQNELVDLGLKLGFEARGGETRARAFGDVNEVTHAFDQLQPDVAGE